jgi:hypothetical protein
MHRVGEHCSCQLALMLAAQAACCLVVHLTRVRQDCSRQPQFLHQIQVPLWHTGEEAAGYGSAACGCDLLLCLQAARLQLHITTPKDSCICPGRGNWSLSKDTWHLYAQLTEARKFATQGCVWTVFLQQGS